MIVCDCDYSGWGDQLFVKMFVWNSFILKLLMISFQPVCQYERIQSRNGEETEITRKCKPRSSCDNARGLYELI